MSVDNIELITKAQKGDMQAFEQLIKVYDKQVMNIAFSYRNNEEDAKDIYQEVFIRVFKGLKNFKFNSEFSTWLFHIATNVCITYHNKKSRHNHDSIDSEISISSDESVKLSDLIKGEDETDRSAIQSDLSRHINNAMNELPAQQKMVFALKHYEGYKIMEIAEMMNCAEGTVKRYLFTATNKMRDKLKGLM